MINPELEQELHKHLNQLSREEQQEVLTYAKTFVAKQPLGVPGASLLQFSGCIPEKELSQMADAIDQACEQVNLNEW